jgi:diadenylate cyclase
MGTEQRSGVRRTTRSSHCDSCANARHRGLLPVLAPGTHLREGIELIRRRNAGALIVLGLSLEVEQICSGGFALDTPLTAAALAELAKMDGAIVIHGERIVRAATHLIPDRGVPTSEAGTRHRTAERVARQTGHPVVSVSSCSGTATLYLDDRGHPLEDPLTLTARAHQALSTLERCVRRLKRATAGPLAAYPAMGDEEPAAVARLLEIAHRCHGAIEDYAAALGAEGRSLLLEREDLAQDLSEELRGLLRALCAISTEELTRILGPAHGVEAGGGVPPVAVPPPAVGDAVEDTLT